MKRLLALVFTMLLLTGCGKNDGLEQGMVLRDKLLDARQVAFSCTVTADYGEILRQFGLEISGDSQGDITFQVTSPDSISGITGTITGGQGALVFDDTVLAFPLLADDQLSPAAAPWVVLRSLRQGYLTSAGEEGEGIRLTLEDTYMGEDLTVDVWTDAEGKPVQGDILYDGRRILTVAISGFCMN